MDSTAHTIQGYSAKQTADIVGITYRQLDYWARTDLVKPSKARATGSGSRRQYSYDDLLRLKVIKRLIDNGIKLEKVRDFFDYVRNELQEDISSANLVIDGANAAIVRSQDELIDALQRGQGVLPLSNIGREVDAAIIEFRPSADDADEEPSDEAGEESAGEFHRAIGET
ncbi:MAG: MerR family transcriptional regulator [Acidimicrobiaceae bacterium]|nr:MerR family transcriptional regulator [Acidimicrobiaceae bacterium]MYB29395.1 MerR family transcriptional regulator [Acidimicrobiaceae bacterium]